MTREQEIRDRLAKPDREADRAVVIEAMAAADFGHWYKDRGVAAIALKHLLALPPAAKAALRRLMSEG